MEILFLILTRMQQKNRRLEERRKRIPDDVDIFVRNSFDIVDRIHQVLISQGKEQKDLASALGKKESEISKWMTGTHNFTIKTLAKISAVLGEPVIQVINDEQRLVKDDTGKERFSVLRESEAKYGGEKGEKRGENREQ